MSNAKPGSRWMGAWLRHRRTSLGLSRRRLVRASQAARDPLTLSIVQELEQGVRLPPLSRLSALAEGLRLRTWVLSELARLAPDLEDHWHLLAGHERPGNLLASAEAWLLRGAHARAAAAAELALREGATGVAAQESARLLLASALWPLGHHLLAEREARLVWEQARTRAGRSVGALVMAEIALDDGRPRTAGVWLEALEITDHVVGQQPLRSRIEVTRAELALGLGRLDEAARTALSAVDLPLGQLWLRHRALSCLAAVADRRREPQQAAHWRSALEGRTGPTGADGPRPQGVP